MKVVSIISLLLFSISLYAAEQSKEEVIKLVDQTCAALEKAKSNDEVFSKIKAKEHPYVNKDNESFYVFVYNKNVDIIAHPKETLLGKNYKGKPDVRGKKFRDEIVDGAIKNGKGWVDYSYQKPGEKGIHPKESYYRLCKDVIVVSGRYQ